VVLGADRERIEKVIANLPVRICYNSGFEEGMHTSILRAFSELANHQGAVMLFLGDQPFIPPAVIQTVANVWRKTGKGIVIPSCGGRRGHPVLFDLRLKGELLRMNPAVGLRSVIQLLPEETEVTEVNFPQILRDIDTKNDYLNELNLIDK